MQTVTRDVALYHWGTFYHVSLKDRDGTPVRCRDNGKCKTWKTRPNDFRLPVKYGFKECFYITQDDAGEWQVTDEDFARVQARARRAALCVLLGVDHSIPSPVLRDLAEERGVTCDF